MPGEYFDALRCRVGDLPDRTLPVRGDRRVAARGAAHETRADGIRRRGPASHVRVRPGLGRGARALAADVQAILVRQSRARGHGGGIHAPWLNPAPDDPSAYFAGNTDGVVCATTALVVDEIAGRVDVKVSGAGIMCARRGPFRVSPSGPVTIPGNGGRAEFEVEYEYHGKRPREFVGAVVSRQRLAREDGDSNDPKLRVELVCATTTATMDPGSPDQRVGDFVAAPKKTGFGFASRGVSTATPPRRPCR